MAQHFSETHSNKNIFGTFNDRHKVATGQGAIGGLEGTFLCPKLLNF
jgi:hypothetical protein